MQIKSLWDTVTCRGISDLSELAVTTTLAGRGGGGGHRDSHGVNWTSGFGGVEILKGG